MISRISIPLLFLLIVVACSSDSDTPGKQPRPLGAFNFDFARLGESPAKQFLELQKIGYTGLTMNMQGEKNLALFDSYLPAIRTHGFKVYAGYIAAKFTNENEALYRQIDKTLLRLKSVDAPFWLIIKATEIEEDALLEIVETIAQKAEYAGVELILYPHDNCAIESAEDALAFTEKLGRELRISLHLCHEIRAGNGGRLTEVARTLGDRLALPSISGADKEFDSNRNWSRTIQPLDRGDYNPRLLLDALDTVAYDGPVILHTFALNKVEADHHHRSFKRYLELNL